MIEASCQIVEKRKIGKKQLIVVFENAVIATKTKPGQFVHVNLGPGSVLRRPFSVYETHRDTFSIMFQVVGKGTGRLATYRAGQFLDIIGPLGHGFQLEGKSPVLVGGGMGAASLRLLHKEFKKQKIEPKVLLGFRDSACSLDWEDSAICTEDGSIGKKGFVTDMLESEIKAGGDIIYGCGPEKMLKKISEIAEKNNLKAYLCLERFMACGVGACLSCICKTKYGKARVCKEGPVFNSKDIIWD